MRKLAIIAVLLFTIAGFIHAQAGTNDFVEVEISNPTPYIGEPFLYSARWYSTEDSDVLDHVAPIWPTFEGLGRVSETYTSAVERRADTLYSVVVIDIWLVPVRSGELIIEPLRFQSSALAVGDQYAIESVAFTVLVRDLPEPVPADFTGAIGPFTVDTLVSTDSFGVGMPFVYEIELTGSGSLQQVQMPAVGFPDTWRVIPMPPSFESISSSINRKVFQWRIIPNQPGNYVIDAVSLSYFDVGLSDYISLSTAPFSVVVAPAGEISQAEVIFPSASEDAPDWVEESGDYWLASDSFVESVFFWLFWLLPVFIFGVVAVVRFLSGYSRISGQRDVKFSKRKLIRSVRLVAGNNREIAEQILGLLGSSGLPLGEEPWRGFCTDLENARYAPDGESGEDLKQRMLDMVAEL
ncbi:MAG: BatD family protein [Anaerolineaceae bacterium]|nr:BatD family protein [Anaerolineaceae bacterium]